MCSIVKHEHSLIETRGKVLKDLQTITYICSSPNHCNYVPKSLFVYALCVSRPVGVKTSQLFCWERNQYLHVDLDREE